MQEQLQQVSFRVIQFLVTHVQSIEDTIDRHLTQR